MKASLLLLSLFYNSCFAQPTWKGNTFKVFPKKIVEGDFTATAISPKEIISDYESASSKFVSREIIFKFSINGKDNEMPSGTDHHFTYAASTGMMETPIILFGTQLKQNTSTTTALPPGSKLRIKLNMHNVLAAIGRNGYYSTFNGTKIYKEDFKSVHIAGNTVPLSWDFDNLVNHKELELTDPDKDGIYETTIILNPPGSEIHSKQSWKQEKDLSQFPQYVSAFPISNAIYNLGMEEMVKAVEPDSTFRTGKEWSGVWTRDISYSIILSMAHLQPAVAKKSLLKKVNKFKKIIQDTGTGGAWPVSSDRMVWAIAAWELFKVTGDRDWLKEAYEITKNSLAADYKIIYDPNTGLVKGESSFLDWREQTYPQWMQPADIFESENLGTNAVHYEANRVMSKMAGLLGYEQEASQYEATANIIRNAINKWLWIPELKYYGQYLYGRSFKTISPRAEALGEALVVLFDIADSSRRAALISHMPVTDYGLTCIYPQIPGIPPYHNNAVWPFVQSYWMWAAAKTGNEAAVMQSIAAIYRPAAMFATNKENFVADNGDFAGTQINSSNMLWSLSGNLSIIFHVLFGIRFHADGLSFEPFVPVNYRDFRSLLNFKYRNAILDITVEGYGNKIASFMLDGTLLTKPFIPASLTGRHLVKITLNNNTFPGNKTNNVVNYTSLATPLVQLHAGRLQWDTVANTNKYLVFKNGIKLAEIATNAYTPTGGLPAEYSIAAVDRKGVTSFRSEPVEAGTAVTRRYEAESVASASSLGYKGASGSFIELNTSSHTKIEFEVSMAEAGTYIINCKYSNGNGPVNTENKCAIRSLLVDKLAAGAFVFPQRGVNEWSNWGYTNGLVIKLTKGKHIFTLAYQDEDENMNIEINQAMLDYLQISKIR